MVTTVFVCMVMRAFSAPSYTPAQFREIVYDPTIRAPICFSAPAARMVMPYYELRTKLALEGKDRTKLPRVFKPPTSKEAFRGGTASVCVHVVGRSESGSGVGHWHPHMMVFCPYYENSMVGGNEFGSPLPQVSDDAGTPFTVVVIPIDDRLAVKARAK